jgi:alanine dehydrogenase
MITPRETMKILAAEAAMQPREELKMIDRKKQSLFIGIPKEMSFQERRIPLTPGAVQTLINRGHRVMIETGAGLNSSFSDNQYSEVGAEISYRAEEVYKADIVLKVAPPSIEEIELMQPRQTLISSLQLIIQPKEALKKLMDKKITAIAWDYIMDEEGIFPIVRAMGEIAGNTAVLVAAELLSNVNEGKGVMMGGITGVAPAEVVIVGAGTVGEFATRAALGLGASVKVFDQSAYKLRRLENALASRIWTSILQPNELEDAISRADVVIGAVKSKFGRTPLVVPESMVRKMKEKSVIVDVSIDRGGCFETSKFTNHQHPTFEQHGVIHYCVPNIPSRVSRTASMALSNIFSPIFFTMGDLGGCANLIKQNQGFRQGVYLYQGTLTQETLGQAYNLPYKNIELLLAVL